MNRPVDISVVTPVYGCADCLEELCRRLRATLEPLVEHFEILLVDDRSPDGAWEVIRELAQRDPAVRGIRLSRNHGQHYAIAAGLDQVRGRWTVVMDCDLQDQPEEIAKLYHKALEGYDQVVGVRENRRDPFFIRITSRLFYVVFNYLSGQRLDNRVANFGIYSRKVIDAVRCHRERDRSFGLLAAIVGFERAQIPVAHAARPRGRSTYDFRKRLNLALDHILSHSTKPLMLAVKTGFTVSLISALFAGWLILRYFFFARAPEGWTSVMVSLFFMAGLTISVIGMVGIYVGKVYGEVKNRPLYILDETTFEPASPNEPSRRDQTP